MEISRARGPKGSQILFLIAAVCLVFVASGARGDSGVPLHGFVDAGWGAGGSDQLADERSRGFSVGVIDLFLTPKLGDNVRSLVEVVFETAMETGEYGAEVERAQVGYLINDALTVWFGRFHTPYGYWATAYHHGAQLQTSIAKPRLIDWEDHGGIMPSHSVGMWMTGKTSVGSGKVLYDVYLTNGNRFQLGELDMNQVRSDKDVPTVGGRLTYRFGGDGALDGLMLGLHTMSGDVNVYGTGGAFLKKSVFNMSGAYAAFEGERLELSSEIYVFSHSNPNVSDSPKYLSSAGFAHAGLRVQPSTVVYGRYESANINQDDPYFSSHNNGYSYNRGLLGVRYDITLASCLKLEGNRTSMTDTHDNSAVAGTAKVTPTTYTEVRAQYAISF